MKAIQASTQMTPARTRHPTCSPVLGSFFITNVVPASFGPMGSAVGSGAPQWGQVVASVETCALHSRHCLSAIRTPPTPLGEGAGRDTTTHACQALQGGRAWGTMGVMDA